MRIGIVTNHNGIGLTRDFELLRDFLTARGHEVIGYQWDAILPDVPKHDLGIFLEVIPRSYLGIADVRWWFANPEWCKQDKFDLAKKYVDKVFTKTREAQRIMEPLLPGKTFHVGFLARDQYDENIVRQNKFLHIGGNSTIRGTQALLDAFRWAKNGTTLQHKLTIVSTTLDGQEVPENVTVLRDVNDEMLKFLQNSHAWHIYPSGTEGFGHALHEAMSVGAFIATTDAPPMNEVDYVAAIPPVSLRKQDLADVHEISALQIYECLEKLSADNHPPHFYTLTRKSIRASFQTKNDSFKEAFGAYMEQLERKAVVEVEERPVRTKTIGRKSIAFLGNFGAPESTENMIAWALSERFGIEVEQLQENETNLSALRSTAFYCDYVLWVRTPGWLRVPDEQMLGFLEELRKRKIPSFSVHLDKFFSIPDREALIGQHPFWKTDHVFTADGGFQEEFLRRGVNHHWMRPAVSEVFCHPGRPREEFRCDVGFVGARSYHREYPFREQMIEFLEKNYGDRFKHIEGVRGHLLNDAYASMKIVVGDCFNAGTPMYYSDRGPETTGRYGLLLHPVVEGFEIPCPVYIPQDLESLKHQIDWWLAEPEDTRRVIRAHCAEYVRQNDTWTKRMEWILETVDANA